MTPQDKDILRYLFIDLHDRVAGVRNIIAPLEDETATELLEGLEYEVWRHLLKLRRHFDVPYGDNATNNKKESDMGNFIKEEGFPQVHGQKSEVTFTIQSGPIKEFGVNGCQIDDVIRWAKDKVSEFNTAFPCRENSLAITKLDEALLWLYERKRVREVRGVEGFNKD